MKIKPYEQEFEKEFKHSQFVDYSKIKSFHNSRVTALIEELEGEKGEYNCRECGSEGFNQALDLAISLVNKHLT